MQSIFQNSMLKNKILLKALFNKLHVAKVEL